jgi:hypothetical protein
MSKLAKWNFRLETPHSMEYDPHIPLFKRYMDITTEAFKNWDKKRACKNHKFGFLYVKLTNVPDLDYSCIEDVPL